MDPSIFFKNKNTIDMNKNIFSGIIIRWREKLVASSLKPLTSANGSECFYGRRKGPQLAVSQCLKALQQTVTMTNIPSLEMMQMTSNKGFMTNLFLALAVELDGFRNFLLGFAFPLMWYYATFLYFGNYYKRDPRERAGLAASAIAAMGFSVIVLIIGAILLF
ncbi:unnamed protein product [Lactuca virosa]|uniref:Uncharacterized protein n=1 Tax=Lactuca virosa TaxID=75947 RepID=A0AAU9N074_9ASTR|nr:unnamed protein product [Lactuca virosa]